LDEAPQRIWSGKTAAKCSRSSHRIASQVHWPDAVETPDSRNKRFREYYPLFYIGSGLMLCERKPDGSIFVVAGKRLQLLSSRSWTARQLKSAFGQPAMTILFLVRSRNWPEVRLEALPRVVRPGHSGIARLSAVCAGSLIENAFHRSPSSVCTQT
jgi:hypothetical protein